MKKNSIHKILLLSAFLFLSLYINKVQAQSTEPVVGSNYYYLTSRDWKLNSIEDLNAVSIPINDGDSFTLMFFVGLPIGTANSMMLSQHDTLSTPHEYEFVDATQQQIVLAPGTSDQQIWTIDYIDADIFIYLASISVNGTLYNYRFKMTGI